MAGSHSNPMMPENHAYPAHTGIPGASGSGRLRFSRCLVFLALFLVVLIGSGQRRFPGESFNDAQPDAFQPREFRPDAFTFVRVEFDSFDDWGYFGEKWKIDHPDADWNFSYRLQEITSLQVDQQGLTLRLTDPRLSQFPFIYMVEPGGISLTPVEIDALRLYLLNGGFMMVDDFWGDAEWNSFERMIRKVFPDKPIIDLTLEHEIFNIVFPLKETLSELPQIPNVGQGEDSRFTGVTWEPRKNPGARDVHYRAIMNDEGHIMVMICHNTDLGDGWEREGDAQYYFEEFSEKKAYPLGINIIFYAMTH